MICTRKSQEVEALAHSKHSTPTNTKAQGEIVHWNLSFQWKQKTYWVKAARRKPNISKTFSRSWMRGWLEVLQSNKHPKERKASSKMREICMFHWESHWADTTQQINTKREVLRTRSLCEREFQLNSSFQCYFCYVFIEDNNCEKTEVLLLTNPYTSVIGRQ